MIYLTKDINTFTLACHAQMRGFGVLALRIARDEYIHANAQEKINTEIWLK